MSLPLLCDTLSGQLSLNPENVKFCECPRYEEYGRAEIGIFLQEFETRTGES